MVAGNWKMNKTVAEGVKLVEELVPMIKDITAVDRVVCPPFTALYSVSETLKGSGIGCGAQDLFWEEKGAYTGEVAPNMVAELGEYVIIGHSERRTYFGETNESVNKKTLAALKIGLTPIVCVGETLEENQGGKTEEIVSGQILRFEHSQETIHLRCHIKCLRLCGDEAFAADLFIFGILFGHFSSVRNKHSLHAYGRNACHGCNPVPALPAG